MKEEVSEPEVKVEECGCTSQKHSPSQSHPDGREERHPCLAHALYNAGQAAITAGRFLQEGAKRWFQIQESLREQSGPRLYKPGEE